MKGKKEMRMKKTLMEEKDAYAQLNIKDDSKKRVTEESTKK